MPALAGNKQLFHPFLPFIGRALSIFRQKMDGPNPSEMDIKMFIPAPTYSLQSRKYIP